MFFLQNRTCKTAPAKPQPQNRSRKIAPAKRA
jgi:hypothetical protein